MRSLAVALLCISASAAVAQSPTDRAARFMDSCQRSNGRDNERFCETRTLTVAATGALDIDGRANGGIAVHGWDKNSVQVVAMIQANARSSSDAQSIAKQVSVNANGSRLRAEGPSTDRDESWSVSYDVYVPRQTNLTLEANNGGISVESMASTIRAETENGGLSFSDVHGDVTGRTVNGGINADLTGDRWLGAGLDLRTSNGGVHLTIPSAYSANLETGTVNGSVNVDFPVTVQGRLGRSFNVALGSGGAPVKAMTTNGGITIRRR